MGLEEGEEEVTFQPNTGSNIEVAKPQIFNGEARDVLGFLTVCKLYIRIRETAVEEQVQWILSYV